MSWNIIITNSVYYHKCLILATIEAKYLYSSSFFCILTYKLLKQYFAGDDKK